MDTESGMVTQEEDPDIPQRPPLEIVENQQLWQIRVYQRGPADGEVFSAHDRQIDAVQATQARMETDTHPCALRWNGPQSVGNLYWNPLFEYLEIRYDELRETWAVVPAEGTCAIASAQSQRTAGKYGKQLQRAYDFKCLRVYDSSGSDFQEREHRFLRYNITDPNVRFDPAGFN